MEQITDSTKPDNQKELLYFQNDTHLEYYFNSFFYKSYF